MPPEVVIFTFLEDGTAGFSESVGLMDGHLADILQLTVNQVRNFVWLSAVHFFRSEGKEIEFSDLAILQNGDGDWLLFSRHLQVLSLWLEEVQHDLLRGEACNSLSIRLEEEWKKTQPPPPKEKTLREYLEEMAEMKMAIAANRPPKPTAIYIAQEGTKGVIKIGISHEVAERIKNISQASGRKMKLLASFPGNTEDEKALHTRFSHLRTQGEWFTPGKDLLEYIKTLQKPSSHP
jgi:Meiotically up-regulated gene 113